MTGSHQPTNSLYRPNYLPRPVDDGGANHLTGMRVPRLALPATYGVIVDLSALRGRTVVFAYPMIRMRGFEFPQGWNDIPGARGCSAQTMSFQDEKDIFAALGVPVFGLSTQTPAYQEELSAGLDLSFAMLSDSELKLTNALRLPTMLVGGMRFTKRLTLIIKDSVIEHVFYPVFPPDESAAEVIAWLHKNPAHHRVAPWNGWAP